MNAEKWAAIKQLFEEALELPPQDRESFVRARGNGEAELIDEALAMLHSNSEGLLDISLIGRDWVRPAALARTLIPGQMLAGRYRITRPIGAGGMGEVYEAEDFDLGARVAVKTMRVENEAALARFKREIQLARTVTHPNVCRIFDLHRHHDPDSGRVITFLTMELVEGETLAEYLRRRGALGPSEALPIVRQIAAALGAAHEKNVVHRDLKAGNVILAGNSSRAVVTDFGLAHPLALATESTVTVIGTPAYMAPEQFEGKPVTAAVDIYAFGVLLYEMVVGRGPFEGESPIALALEKIRKEPPQASDAVPSLPGAWSAGIRRCLQPNPEHRYATVAELLRQLEESVHRRPLLRLSRAHKRVLAAAALILSVLAVAGWRYQQSVYVPSGEALHHYRLASHAQQIGLPWKASQLFERALEDDPNFVAARAHLAEAWIDLDQPERARDELERAKKTRPRWRRIAPYESLLEQAANAQLKGDLAGSARLYQRATDVAPDSEKLDVRFSAASAQARAGDLAAAVTNYLSIALGPPCRGAAILAHARLIARSQRTEIKRRFDEAGGCFESAGDLDGHAQELIAVAQFLKESDVHSEILDFARSAETIARTIGNIEQLILASALVSEVLLDNGEEEAAYSSFTQAMQLADRNGLRFLSARLLNERAAYFFEKEDFLQSEHFNQPAVIVSRSAKMPWTFTRCAIRRAKVFIRMNVPAEALHWLAAAEGQLRQFPNAALSAEVSQLVDQAKHTRSRQESTLHAIQ